MNTVVLRGWHCAIHSAPVPKRAWRQGGITAERGGETDSRRKERDRPAANSPNEMFPAADERCVQKLRCHLRNCARTRRTANKPTSCRLTNSFYPLNVFVIIPASASPFRPPRCARLQVGTDLRSPRGGNNKRVDCPRC